MDFFSIEYNLGCNSCMNGDGTRHSMMVTDGNLQTFLEATDYQVTSEVMKWRLEDDYTCQFCGSRYVEVQDAEVSGKKLYDYDLLVNECKAKGNWIYMINIQKKNGQVDISIGGKRSIESEIIESCIARIRHEIRKRRSGFYQSHDRGHFFICFTGSYEEKAFEATVQKYVCHGFSIEEVMDVLFHYVDQNGLKWL